MKTNIKMRVTPEQSMKVQNIVIANLNTQNKVATTDIHFPYIVISTMGTFGTRDMEFYKIQNYKEIDADLFIRTNGTCEEDELKNFIQSQNEIKDGINEWAKQFNDIKQKQKKKNEILKKARIKRKNQREELHKLNLKLQKCISLGEHRKVLDWHIERNESLFVEIDNLKAENKSLKESSKISCNMLHSQKDKIDRLELNYVVEQSNYKKEIEKLKAVIEYVESKAK